MEYQGHVQNGVVVPEGNFALPEGAVVSILYPVSVQAKPTERGRRIQLPLVHCQQPGSIQLTNQRIAEILDAEDATP